MTTSMVHEGISAHDYRKLIEIGIKLSAETDFNRLMETILVEAKDMYHADGGTLYIVEEDPDLLHRVTGGKPKFRITDKDREHAQVLRFTIMQTTSLGIKKGGTTGEDIPIPPIPLYIEDTGEQNKKAVAACAAFDGVQNIPDAYEVVGLDFSGAKKFDEAMKYRTKSVLALPMKNFEGRVIGVLQLINAQNPKTKEVVPFNHELQPLIEALASQAAVALDNQQLIQGQKQLLESFISLIAGAIDAKSPYTGGHCQRVPELTDMLAEAVSRSDDPRFKSFNLDDEQKYELHIAGLLHDCGKVTTPEHVVDKATKLETIYDRIHEIRTRFEVLKRDAEIDYWKKLHSGDYDPEALRTELYDRLNQLDDEFAFVADCNVGGEFMAPEKVDRLREIAARTWLRTLDDRLGIGHEELKRKERVVAQELPVVENLLSDKAEHIIPRTDKGIFEEGNPYGFKMNVPDQKFNLGELYNLAIARGTLTEEDRFKINDHIVQTIIMLDQLPFPRNLKRVPELAGGHHEKMDGTGYPRRLEDHEMSWEARMMAISDIFEALTAADRPYKKPKTLSEALKIMWFMKKDKHIDGALFDVFLKEGVYLEYAERFLLPEQIDDVDISKFLDAPQAS